MPTSDKSAAPEILVDTSVAVALLVSDHPHHETTAAALGGRRLGLAGHAAFETFSVLTRLPSPARRSAEVVAHLIRANFPASRYLSAEASATMVARIAAAGLSGGSVYDALVAAAAVEHGVALATRDRRALPVYRWMEAQVELL